MRAWRGLPGYEGRSSLRTWLFRIATNACLNRLDRRPARTIPLDFGPPAAPGEGPGAMLEASLWLGPYPDRFLVDDEAEGPEAAAVRGESVELAFVAALQRLSSRARAVLILRAVLDYSAQETAGMLGTSVAAVNSSLQRARAALAREVPSRSQGQTLPRPRRRPGAGPGRPLRPGDGDRRRGRAARPAGRGRDLEHAADAHLVPGQGGDRRVPVRVRVPAHLAPRADERQRPARRGLLPVGRGGGRVRRRGDRRPHPRRRPDPGGDRVRGPAGRGPVRPARPAARARPLPPRSRGPGRDRRGGRDSCPWRSWRRAARSW